MLNPPLIVTLLAVGLSIPNVCVALRAESEFEAVPLPVEQVEIDRTFAKISSRSASESAREHPFDASVAVTV